MHTFVREKCLGRNSHLSQLGETGKRAFGESRQPVACRADIVCEVPGLKTMKSASAIARLRVNQKCEVISSEIVRSGICDIRHHGL